MKTARVILTYLDNTEAEYYFITGLTDDIQEYLNDTRGKLNLTVLEKLPG